MKEGINKWLNLNKKLKTVTLNFEGIKTEYLRSKRSLEEKAAEASQDINTVREEHLEKFVSSVASSIRACNSLRTIRLLKLVDVDPDLEKIALTIAETIAEHPHINHLAVEGRLDKNVAKDFLQPIISKKIVQQKGGGLIRLSWSINCINDDDTYDLITWLFEDVINAHNQSLKVLDLSGVEFLPSLTSQLYRIIKKINQLDKLTSPQRYREIANVSQTYKKPSCIIGR